MTFPQVAVLAIILAAMALFMWGRWRHDVVAMGALLACVLTGLVPGGDAFAGFGHPAVVTVACVLVLSYGLQVTGAVNFLADRVLPKSAGPGASILAITALGAFLSAFMNNVGALALLMPVGMQIAERNHIPPARSLCPWPSDRYWAGQPPSSGPPPTLSSPVSEVRPDWDHTGCSTSPPSGQR